MHSTVDWGETWKHVSDFWALGKAIGLWVLLDEKNWGNCKLSISLSLMIINYLKPFLFECNDGIIFQKGSLGVFSQ